RTRNRSVGVLADDITAFAKPIGISRRHRRRHAGEVTSPVRARFPCPASAFGDDLISEGLISAMASSPSPLLPAHR
ncbi:MAG: hypothetical protein NZM10_00625, partial [Fimbriimonadales bacterium]|nr:hypothetical protein [Fimbriimonadales bacterium]